MSSYLYFSLHYFKKITCFFIIIQIFVELDYIDQYCTGSILGSMLRDYFWCSWSDPFYCQISKQGQLHAGQVPKHSFTSSSVKALIKITVIEQQNRIELFQQTSIQPCWGGQRKLKIFVCHFQHLGMIADYFTTYRLIKGQRKCFKNLSLWL